MNRLEIKETDQAKNYLDEKVYFLREDYGLVSAMQAVVRTGCCFFAVVSLSGKIVGTLTIRELFEVVAGKLSEEEFDDDNRIAAVVKRILK